MKNSRIFASPRLLIPIVVPFLFLSVSLLVCVPQAVAQNPQDRDRVSARQIVIHWESPARLHKAIGTDKGSLKIGEEGIEFRSLKGRIDKWPFIEVQTFRLSPNALTIQTYQNRHHHFPGMQRYRFDLGQAVPPALAAELSHLILRPSQNAVPDPVSVAIAIPAHHRTLTGGTNGTLRLSDDGIEYVTGARGDSRNWRWDDLETLSNPDPFHLLVLGYRDTYSFDLKEPLPRSTFYHLVDALDAQVAADSGQKPNAQSPNNGEKLGQGGRHE
jgi:hypothetical protein